MLQLVEEQVKIVAEKRLGSLFSMICNKIHLNI